MDGQLKLLRRFYPLSCDEATSCPGLGRSRSCGSGSLPRTEHWRWPACGPAGWEEAGCDTPPSRWLSIHTWKRNTKSNVWVFGSRNGLSNEHAAPAKPFSKAAASKSSSAVASRQGETSHHVDCETSRQIFGFNYEKCAVAESNMTGGVVQNNSLW